MNTEKDSEESGIEFRIPKVLPLLPLRNTVIFPQQILPLSIGGETDRVRHSQ